MPTYCKIVREKNIRFQFRCSMNDAPETVGQLRRLVRGGDAILLGNRVGQQRRLLTQLQPTLLLDTDWETQGKPQVYINWIPTENT